MQKSAPRCARSASVSVEAALFHYDILGIARADHSLGVNEAVHIDCDPAIIHEDEVRVADQSDMTRSKSLHEEVLWMSSKAEHFSVTRPELLFIHNRRGLIRVPYVRVVSTPDACLVRSPHVRLARGGPFSGRILFYLLRTTLYVRLSANI